MRATQRVHLIRSALGALDVESGWAQIPSTTIALCNSTWLGPPNPDSLLRGYRLVRTADRLDQSKTQQRLQTVQDDGRSQGQDRRSTPTRTGRPVDMLRVQH
jgi:hypothetical protein